VIHRRRRPKIERDHLVTFNQTLSGNQRIHKQLAIRPIAMVTRNVEPQKQLIRFF
jgi:hypothetical protein